MTRTLTVDERDALRESDMVDSLTCEGDGGYGPCGASREWTDGSCAQGHEIEVWVDGCEDL